MRLFWIGLAVVCWALWTTRNKFTIEHIFPAKSADCLFKACLFLQQWRLLTKLEDKHNFDLLLAKIRLPFVGGKVVGIAILNRIGAPLLRS